MSFKKGGRGHNIETPCWVFEESEDWIKIIIQVMSSSVKKGLCSWPRKITSSGGSLSLSFLVEERKFFQVVEDVGL